MRALVAIVAALAALAAAPRAARADDCWAGPADDPFPTCFYEPGTRLYLQLAYGGVGGGLALRHIVRTDDKDITWRLDHRLAEAAYDGRFWRGELYHGGYLRHSKDGHLVLPTSPPKKLFLPFDIGADVDVGTFTLRPGEPAARLGLVRAALVFDLARSDDFRRRIVFGVATRWDVDTPDVTRPFSDAEHYAAPFSLGVAGLHLESGLGVLDVSVEAGSRWSSKTGWGGRVDASASLERVVVAFDDRPLSLYAASGWEAPGRGAWVTAGVRLALVVSKPTRPGR